MKALHTYPLALTASGDSWVKWEVPCDLEQLDIEAVDTGASNAGVAVRIATEDPTNKPTRRGFKPVPADGVWSLTGSHIPETIWVATMTSGSTTPTAMLTAYRKQASCGCGKA